MKKITIKIISLIVIGLALSDYFFGKYSADFGNPLPDIVKVILIIVSIRYLIVSKNFNFILKNRFNKIYCLIIIYLFIACLFSPIGIQKSMLEFSRIFFPFILLISSYLLSFNGHISTKQIYFLYKNLTLVFFILIIGFLNYKSSIGRMTIGDNNAYSLLFCSPIIFLFFPKIKAIFYYSLIITGSLIAAKRGAFLGVIFTSLIFIYSFFRQFRFKSKFIVLLCLPMLLALGYKYFTDSIFIFERFLQLEQDGGSGRDVISLTIWEGWQKGNLLNQIIGNGWMSELEYIKSEMSMKKGLMAHNDWLQFLYDTGLVGILLLLSVFIALLAQIRSYKRKDRLYTAMMCISGIFFLRSISGGTFGSTQSMPYLFIGLGFILGKADRVKYGMQAEY